MRYCPECALLGWGAAATLAMLFSALEWSIAAIPATHGSDPISVNRTFKGDRSPALPGASRVVPEAPTIKPKLPHGCVSETGRRRNAYTHEVTGRCVV